METYGQKQQSQGQGTILLRRALLVLGALFIIAIFTQVFLAGLSVFTGPTWWNNHVLFGHYFGVLAILITVIAPFARLPRRLFWLAIAMLPLYGLQYAFITGAGALQAPWLAALHPVNALIMLWIIMTLIRSLWKLS